MGVGYDLYRGRNDFDFPRLFPKTTALSIVLMVVSVVALFGRGLNLSLDFEGGSVWEVPGDELTVDEAETVMAEFGPDAGDKYQEAETVDGERVLRIQGRVESVAEATEVATALAEAAGVEPGEVNLNTVGPSWGDDITKQARTSLIVFMVLVAAYITWRLEARMAVAALVAVVHDILLTVGVYALLQLEITPATVISFLTILGFSLYDTIVVYDRVQENAERIGRTGQYTYTAIMRHSLNQVLMRSLNTTIITVLPILAMLLVGRYVFDQQTLLDFSLALLIGLISGTYSSVFVASPLTIALKERETRWREIRSRLVNRGVDVTDTAWHGLRTAAVAGVGAPRQVAASSAKESSEGSDGGAGEPGGSDAGTATGSSGDGAAFTATGHPPRPRKKRR
jgi:preprotein translocase subunit SecF